MLSQASFSASSSDSNLPLVSPSTSSFYSESDLSLKIKVTLSTATASNATEIADELFNLMASPSSRCGTTKRALWDGLATSLGDVDCDAGRLESVSVSFVVRKMMETNDLNQDRVSTSK